MSNFTSISDDFWNIIKPLLIKKQRNLQIKYKRKEGGGRKNLDFRQVFCGILYVLKTGSQWKAIPKEFGSSSSIHEYFRYWESLGVFHKTWELGLIIYDEMQGIAWEWQALDASHIKSPMGNDSVRKSPVDRGKKWNKKTFINGRKWYPVISINNRRKSA